MTPQVLDPEQLRAAADRQAESVVECTCPDDHGCWYHESPKEQYASAFAAGAQWAASRAFEAGLEAAAKVAGGQRLISYPELPAEVRLKMSAHNNACSTIQALIRALKDGAQREGAGGA